MKWILKLRVKRNSSRISIIEGYLMDIKSRLENIETNFNMRGEGLEHWISEIEKLREATEID